MAHLAPVTRAQSLAATIEVDIANRRLAEGDALGTIESWRETSGFARATVSEAVRLLVDRGSVEIRPGRSGGLFVARTGPVVRLRHTLLSVHGEATTLADAIAIREALEPLIAADAARSRTTAAVRRLRSGLTAIESSLDDHDAFIRAVWALHENIAAITPNGMLRAIYLTIMQVINDSAEQAISDAPAEGRAYRERRLAVHEQLVAAIDSGDSALVAEAMRSHAGEQSS